MEYNGRIMRMLPQRSGTSQKTGNDWVAQPFVFEYYEDERDIYSSKVVLETFDRELIERMSEGRKCHCVFKHFINDYNGRVYNEVRLYRMELVGDDPKPEEKPQEKPQETPQEKPSTGDEKTDDLPF
jgi:hypothetical protein